MNSEKRKLTLLIEFEKDNPPTWIWNSHLSKSYLNGFAIIAIGEGDQMIDPFNLNTEEMQ